MFLESQKESGIPMSASNTPSQHNSTLTISPLVPNKSSSQSHIRRWTVTMPTSVSVSTVYTQTPHNPITHSPLVQKNLTTPAHPHSSDPVSTVGVLASMTKGGLFGPVLPPTRRKISDNGDFRSDGTNDPVNNSPVNLFDISNLSSAEKLRLWRHDALMQHHYKTAEYIGDKVYSLTHDPNDAFWLAQVYYNKGAYIRAVELLSRDDLDTTSVMCRYLAALCLINMEKYDDALDIVGETNPFKDESAIRIKNQDGGIKLESSLCYLRGQIYAAQHKWEKAKESFKESVMVDVKNFEAFDRLISNNLLTPDEEWEFLNALNFSDLDDNEELIKCLYTTKLSKYRDFDQLKSAQQCLIDEYNLGDNNDVKLTEIEILNNQGKFTQCLELCEQILTWDEFNFNVLPSYIQCLHALGSKNKLFLISHKLAENFPKCAITWFAVATYNMCIEKISEARKYYSKASILDPNFGYAWLGFAHTYALEGEHEQALSAYSTAARFFPGTHLPSLYLGMQYSRMDTLSLAEEYFMMAYDICPTDPLLLNELGVVYYKKTDFLKAKTYLKKAYEAINASKSESKSWISVYSNLGHTYRKMGDEERALKCFKTVLENWKPTANIWCSLGFIYMKMKKMEKAIEALHNALALDPPNQTAQQLLKAALDINVHVVLDNDHLLFVTTKINEKSNTFNLAMAKKRTLINGDISKIAKRLKQGDITSDEEGNSMELE